MSEAKARELGTQNTDRELWREREGDYYADSIHVTATGGIGLNCGGHVIVMPLREWHRLAAVPAPAEPTRELVDACNGLLGLIQLVASRDDLPPGLDDLMRLSHRVTTARQVVERYGANPDDQTITPRDVLDMMRPRGRATPLPAAEPVAQPECDHDWRDRRSHDDPYALDTCCKCGAVRGEDEPVAQPDMAATPTARPSHSGGLAREGEVGSAATHEPVAQQPPPRGDCGCSDYELCIDKPNCKRAAAPTPEAPPLPPGAVYAHDYAEGCRADPERAAAMARAAAEAPQDERYRKIPGDPIAPWFDRAKKAEAELAEANERIRTLEADLGRYMMLANTNAADLAASRERERAGAELLRDVVRYFTCYATHAAPESLLARIKAHIASPDSAPAGTGETN